MLENCKGCSNDTVLRSTLAFYSNKKQQIQKKAKKNFERKDVSKVLKEKTKEIINNLNRDYCKNYRTTFTKQFKETLDLHDVKNIAKQ